MLNRVRTVVSLWRSGDLTSRQVVRIAMRLAGFERWGVRPITQARFRALNHAAEQGSDLRGAIASWLAGAAPSPPGEPEPATQADLMARLRVLAVAHREALDAAAAARTIVARNSALTANLEHATRTIGHLRRVELEYRAAVQRLDAAAEATGLLQITNRDLQAVNQEILRTNRTLSDANAAVAEAYQRARHGVQAMVNEWQRILFEVGDDTGPSEAAATLVLADRPVGESLATLINLSEAAHGARPFQHAVSILAQARPFPLPWRTDLPALRIVDVGSQELASESDMHAPLRAVAPVEVIGFDPFAAPAAADDGLAPASIDVVRADGRRIKTFPTLLADGNPVTFHVNRYDATSSILPSNHALTRQFGLLDLSVETIETRTLQSRRMDDVLPVEGEDARIDLLKIDVQGAAQMLLANAPKVLRNTLVCHVEIEFAPVYLGEGLFGDIDTLLRAAGFCFVDFFSLGRQRYASFDDSPDRAFHRGRTLWGDCIYMRGLDTEGALSAADLFRGAVIAHCCYNKQDLAAELLGRLDALAGTALRTRYVESAGAGAAA